MKIIKIITHILSYICYVLIGIYALICIPIIFKYKPLVVLTGSMEPTFKVGSIIYYKEVPQNQIKVGDIITFKYDDTFISHRVNNINGLLYETKGDANNTADNKKITYSNIVGKDMDFCIPYLGYYVKFINDNMYLLIIVAVILVADFILSNIGKKDDKTKEEIINAE
jgi:signal peptidase